MQLVPFQLCNAINTYTYTYSILVSSRYLSTHIMTFTQIKIERLKCIALIATRIIGNLCKLLQSIANTFSSFSFLFFALCRFSQTSFSSCIALYMCVFVYLLFFVCFGSFYCFRIINFQFCQNFFHRFYWRVFNGAPTHSLMAIIHDDLRHDIFTVSPTAPTPKSM